LKLIIFTFEQTLRDSAALDDQKYANRRFYAGGNDGS
jgi:hypothetical protein